MDSLTKELGEMLDKFLGYVSDMDEYTYAEEGHLKYQAIQLLRKYHMALAAEREARPQDDCGIGRYLSEAE